MARDAVSAEPRAQIPHEQGNGPAYVLLAIGIWLPLANFVLGYSEAGDARVVESVLGASLIWFSVWKLTGRALANGTPRYAALIGVLLLIAPVVVRYGFGSERAVAGYLNSMLLGAVVIGVSVWMGRRQKGA